MIQDYTFYTVPLVNTLPWYQLTITLDGVVYTLSLRYNVRSDNWFMDIQDSAANPIVSGLPILIQRSVSGQYAYLAIPPGIFVATDNSGQGTQPTQFSFGIDHTFYYGDVQ